jgi:RND superfamily putative drug exporter
MNFYFKLIKKYSGFLVLFWILLLSLFLIFASKLSGNLEGDGFTIKGDYQKVNTLLVDVFDAPQASLFVLFEKQDSISAEEYTNQYNQLYGELSDLTQPGVSVVAPTDANRKETISYIQLDLRNLDNRGEIIDNVRSIIEPYTGSSLTGGPVIQDDFSKASQEDLVRAELIGLPVALIVLIFAFGTLFASIIPLFIGIFSIIISFGILYFISGEVTLSVFALNITPMIGLALSIDFALIFINRYREELLLSNKYDAIETTIKTAGKLLQ